MNIRQPMKRTLLALAAIVALAATSASSAGARTDTQTAPSARNCVITIAPLQPGATSSATSAPRCYATFAQAIADASNGTVNLPTTATPAAVTDATLAPALATGSSIIGIDWIDANYSGASLTWQVSNPNGCNGYQYSSNVTGSWNNVISSSKGFTGYDINPHYDLAYPNQNNGAKIFCTPNCATMGAMNDATSYEEWRP